MKLSLSRRQIGAHDKFADSTSPNVYSEKDVIHTIPHSIRNIPCPDMTDVGVEHTLKHKTCFVCPQNFM
jgi:hypothetical protein